MSDERPVPQNVLHPSRVLVDDRGLGTTPEIAAKQHKIVPIVVFVRDDGWTLGTPGKLIPVAERMYRDTWIERWDLLTDGTWQLSSLKR